MAISEPRFAAEVIDPEGRVFKFDDIGCMARFARERHIDLRTIPAFVMDFDASTWIPARDAVYVKAPGIQSPMASGILAVRHAAAAQRYSARYGAPVLNLEQVTWTPEQ